MEEEVTEAVQEMPQVLMEDLDLELESQMLRTNKQLLKGWDISIEHLDHGVIVRIGCKRLAFSSTEEAMTEVQVWTTDPKSALKKWFKKLHE